MRANDPEDGTLPASALTWTFSLYQAAEETPNQFILRNSQSIQWSLVGLIRRAPTGNTRFTFRRRLPRPTDSTGLQTTVSERLDPQLVNFNIQSTPPGLSLIINGRHQDGPVR